MRSIEPLTIIVILLLLVSPLLPRIAMAQLSQGNWVVTGTQVVQNESITLNGNLTVESGGNLTLRNVNLAMNVQSNGQYGIFVEAGGALYVYRSKVTSVDQVHRFALKAQGSEFVASGSTIENVGWCSASYAKECPVEGAGVFVGTNGADIVNNTISDGGIGLILAGTRISVSRNLISQNDLFALELSSATHCEIINNTMLVTPGMSRGDIAYVITSDNNTFSGNTMEETNRPAWQSGGGMDGIALVSSDHNVVSKNNISVANIAVFPYESSDTNLLYNRIVSGEAAIYVSLVGVNAEVIGNVVTSVFNQAWGIVISHGQDSIIVDNTLSVQAGYAMALDHSSDVALIDNNVSDIGQVGALLYDSSGDTLLGNSFSGAQYGLFMTSGSDHNLVQDNSFSGNHSVFVVDSGDNLLYGNNFYDSKNHYKALPNGPFDNGNNSWYSGSQGNYWELGGLAYTRATIAPSGKESFSLPSSLPLVHHNVPNLVLVSIPPQPTSNQIAMSTIRDKTMSIPSGCLLGNVTIIDSTITFGATGPVLLGCGNAASITIENSRLVDGGFGFILGAGGPSSSLVVKNSTVDGAYMQDLVGLDFVLENDTFVNLETAGTNGAGILIESAQNVTITGSAFSDLPGQGVGFYCGAAFRSLLVTGNTFRNTIGGPINSACLATPDVVIANNEIYNAWSAYFQMILTTTSVTKTLVTSSTSSPSLNSMTSTTTSSGSSISSGGGGIPEFPFQLLAATVITSLIVASYALSRRKR
ncbi:MAG: right-handed parallel beta-helix repeat-containing protein [Thaumarchaeota archaeon]|nr:right-handed parallel beta-helix repeat-containing protein [Nitrososphaerota archaeon]